MSTRFKNGSYYENHQRATELHENAAHAHLTATVAHEKEQHQTGPELSRQALEHAQKPDQHAGETPQNAVNEHGFPIFGHDDIAVLAHELW